MLGGMAAPNVIDTYITITGSMAVGASIGAVVGSELPVIGTAAGASVGTVVGAVASVVGVLNSIFEAEGNWIQTQDACGSIRRPKKWSREPVGIEKQKDLEWLYMARRMTEAGAGRSLILLAISNWMREHKNWTRFADGMAEKSNGSAAHELAFGRKVPKSSMGGYQGKLSARGLIGNARAAGLGRAAQLAYAAQYATDMDSTTRKIFADGAERWICRVDAVKREFSPWADPPKEAKAPKGDAPKERGSRLVAKGGGGGARRASPVLPALVGGALVGGAAFALAPALPFVALGAAAAGALAGAKIFG